MFVSKKVRKSKSSYAKSSYEIKLVRYNFRKGKYSLMKMIIIDNDRKPKDNME